MIGLVRSEWIKFRSVRSTVVTLLAAVALVVLAAILVAHNMSKPGRSGPFTDVMAATSVASLLFGVLGIQVIGQEFRFSTIRPTFSAEPRRLRVLFAKLLVVCLACAAGAAALVALCRLVAALMVSDLHFDGIDNRAMWGVVLFSGGVAALGMGIGMIVRQPIAGIVILLADAFVAEGILSEVIKGSRPWLPFSNGVQMATRFNDEGYRSTLAGGIYFFVVVAIIWAIGAILTIRRDA